MDIVSELRRRQASLGHIMEENKLDAVLIAGNSSVGPLSYGCFRYYTDHRVYYHLQAIVARPEKPIMICCGSILHLEALRSKGFEDIRVSPDILGSVLNTLTEQPVKRLGVSLEMLPSLWYLELSRRLPGVEFVDVTEDVFLSRSEHSEYEVQATRECAKIADAGYKAVCEMAAPGVRMSELHAELDCAMKKAGAEEIFTLMSNGRFSYVNNNLGCIRPFGWPDDRVIKHGDNIGMEITPRYKGYWTQMVRTICIGEPNPDLEKAHRIQLAVIAETVPLLKPGVTLGEVLKHMWEYGKSFGMIPKLPFGHIVGIDLDEGGRGSLESDFVLTKNANFVLHPTLVLGEMDYSIFWGDPYLVTEKGGERISESSTELKIL